MKPAADRGSAPEVPVGKLWVLLVVAAVVLLPGLLVTRDFTITDEARYAEVLREMRADGHWIVPFLNGAPYPDKPPLFFWLTLALAPLTGGLTPRAGVLVAVLSALALVGVSWSLARRGGGERAGLAAGYSLASMLLFLICAQIVRMDMTMALFVALSVASLMAGLRGARWGYTGSHLFAALAVLTKGPLGVAIPAVTALVVFVRRRAWRELRRYAVDPGLALELALIGGWLAAAWFLGEREYLRTVFVDQLAGRALNDTSHGQPFWFYAALLPVLLLPWSPLVARALWARRGTWSERDEVLWAWFLGGLAVLSAVHGKLFIYVLPLLPPLAVLAAPWLARLWERDAAGERAARADRGALALGAVLSLGLPLTVALLVPLAVRRAWIGPEYAAIPRGILLTWCAAWLAACLAFVARSRVRATLASLFVSAAGVPAILLLVVFPSVSEGVSPRRLGGDLAALRAEGWSVASSGLTGDNRGILSFYADAVVPDLPRAEVRAWLAVPGRAVVVKWKNYLADQAALDELAEVRARRALGGREYGLLVSRAEAR